MGYTWFRLSRKPEEGENIVLNFSFEKGDKSIGLARSYRFEFNEENWDVPAFAVFKLDPKLDKPTSASFSGLSGNIRFAWTMVFVVVALLFAGFHIYHRFALPRPAEDHLQPVRGGRIYEGIPGHLCGFFQEEEHRSDPAYSCWFTAWVNHSW